MLILVTYDVETVTPKGRHRLQMVAKACKTMGRGFKTQFLSVWLTIRNIHN